MKHLTASEASEVTAKYKKSKDELNELINAMAKNGNDYATVKAKDVLNPEDQKAYWESLGYKVQLDEYFSITW